MKQIFIKLQLLVLAAMLPFCAFAQISFEGVNYSIVSEEDKTVEVVNNSSFSGFLNVPSQIIVNDKTYTVIRIGMGAFASNQNITGVFIGDSVKTIDAGAFFNCSAMNSISLPEKLETIGMASFKNCTSLKKIDFPDSLRIIGENAFAGCTNLDSISWPKNLKEIRSSAFYQCTSLTTFLSKDSLENIGNQAFYECSSLTTAVFGKSLKLIDQEAFEKCSKLSDVSFSGANSLEKIDNMAFYECTSLTEVILPNQLSNIGQKVFRGCKKLKYVHLPDSLESIPYGLFYDCGELVCIAIPKMINKINNDVFKNCENLKHVYVGWGKDNIVAYSFNFLESQKEGLLLYVPASLREDYVNAGWDVNIADGSETFPYQIANIYDIDCIGRDVKSGNNYVNCKFITVANVTDTIYSPIGDAEHCFSGIFEGNNYSFTLGIDAEDDCAGLFANVNGATIKNLVVKGYLNGFSNLGAFAGKALDSQFLNCINEAEIKGSGDNIAGIVGYIDSSKILNCSNTSRISNSLLLSSCTGGLVGKMKGESNITNCVNSGDVVSEGSVGAIVGKCDVESDTPVLSNCFWKNADDLNIGNIIAGSVENCEPFIVDGFSAILEEAIEDNSDLIDVLNSVAEENGFLNWMLNSSFYDCMYVLSQENVGSSEDVPYIISSKNDLDNLAKLVKSGKNFLGQYFVVSNDIDDPLTITIGDSLHHFCGIFDGGAHTIALAINEPSSKYIGLFSYLENATIKNIAVSGTVTGDGYVGGIAGYGVNSSLVNCSNLCEISSNGDVTGGIVAYLKTVDDRSCNVEIARNRGKIHGVGQETGGIVGHIERNVTLNNCVNEGIVIGSNNNIGGIVGKSYNHNTLRNSINTGEVYADAEASNIGGIVGSIEYFSYFNNCSNIGKVGSESSKYVGGIAGYASNHTFNLCCNSGEIVGINRGAIAATVSSMGSPSYYCYWLETEGLYASTSIDYSIVSSGTFNIIEGEAVLNIDGQTSNLIETLNNNIFKLDDPSLYYNWSMYRNANSENMFVLNEMQINVSDKGWATVSLPFTAKMTSNNASAYYIATSGDDVVKTEASVIPAGTGFIIKSNSGESATVLFSPSEEVADDTTGNQMVGSLRVGGEVFCAPAYRYYILTDGAKGFQFYWDVKRKDEGRSAYCSQYKAVLAVENEEAFAREIYVLDEATNIEDVDIAQKQSKISKNGLYNLVGQEVSAPIKGKIYISNGQKFLSK